MPSKEDVTHVCRLCHFPAELDDIALRSGGGRYICLRCFARETDAAKPFPKQLRREIERALAGPDEAEAA